MVDLMICEIRFLSKGDRYDKTLAKINRECVDFAQALRFAAAVYDKSEPAEKLAMTSVRIRTVVPGVVNVQS